MYHLQMSTSECTCTSKHYQCLCTTCKCLLANIHVYTCTCTCTSKHYQYLCTTCKCLLVNVHSDNIMYIHVHCTSKNISMYHLLLNIMASTVLYFDH